MTMSERVIDLRSDTVTVPSDGMRRAMATADVGDDVYGEDPNVNRLQEMAAEITGKEAALYVPSGTMSNLLAILTHCRHGDEAICGSDAHILQYEMSGAATLGGVQLRAVPNSPHGGMSPDDIAQMARPVSAYFPRTTLLCIENTHNRCSGGVLSVDETASLADAARAAGLRVHIDGARIFNAAIASGASVRDLAAPADSIGFCLSKGLGAPVGTVLCGDAAFIKEAHGKRRMLGGGMRQAGIIAAAGIYALEHMVERLAEDHEHARILARGLAEMRMIALDPETIQTNIVIFGVRGDTRAFLRALQAAGVLAGSPKPGYVRMVTHYGIERADVEDALGRIRHAASAPA